MDMRAGAAKSARTWLTSLARDTRGNTLAIVAASILPLAGMVGGGVDISRMYIVKTRLQHACDAGALAGRKQMGGGTWAYDNNAAERTANSFFKANIQASPYGASSVTHAFTENAGKVSGTASATVPMTLMRVFGKTSETLSVTCDAEMRLPNTDVMFVLDTTGSMRDKAVSTDTQTKMQALKSAVKCFYEIVARLDTTEVCATGTPSGGTGNTVQIRFGFVPYATNVNVGKLLKTDWIADNWSYQSREPQWNTTTTSEWSPAADSTGVSGTGTTDWTGWNTVSTQFLSCPAQPANQNVAGSFVVDTAVVTSGNTRTWQTRTYSRYDIEYRQQWSGLSCSLQSRRRGNGNYTSVDHTQTLVTTTQRTFARWRYALISHNVSALKNGTSWNSSVNLPIGNQGASVPVNWDGCIEERQTARQANYSPIPAGAKDLDIDSTPVSGDATTQWGPLLRGAIFARDVTSSWNQLKYSETLSTSNFYNSVPYYCPKEAKKLQSWPTASEFEGYVNGLSPDGNTYHDIGLLWGARLISPTGIFRSENEYTPQGGEIERHLIFMTDGEVCVGVGNPDTGEYPNDYTAYGLPWLDRRTTDPSQAPTGGCLTTGTVTQQVNARTQAICTAVKNKNITLWVIWFGASNTTIEGLMNTCATPGRFFTARNAADLQSTFKKIADQISQLRLTR